MHLVEEEELFDDLQHILSIGEFVNGLRLVVFPEEGGGLFGVALLLLDDVEYRGPNLRAYFREGAVGLQGLDDQVFEFC